MSCVGVTATRHGLTTYQLDEGEQMLAVLRKRGFDTLRHGDCVGGDAELAEIARRLGYRLIAHPPISDLLRAFVPSDIVLPPLPYTRRNRAIVDNSAYLIGCPNTWPEVLRSGTWATIRYARRQELPVAVIPPSQEWALSERWNGWLNGPVRLSESPTMQAALNETFGDQT